MLDKLQDGGGAMTHIVRFILNMRWAYRVFNEHLVRREVNGRMNPTTVMKWSIDYPDWEAAAQSFKTFWERYISSEHLILQEIYKGFNIIERASDRHVANILLTRPPTGNLQIDVRVTIVNAPISIIPQSELMHILEEFRSVTGEIEAK